MTQSRRASLSEAVANIVVGIFFQAGGQAFLFYAMHIQISKAQFGLFTAVMTVLSLIRSYCLRRCWNAEWWKRKKKGLNPYPGAQTEMMKTPSPPFDYCHCGLCAALRSQRQRIWREDTGHRMDCSCSECM